MSVSSVEDTDDGGGCNGSTDGEEDGGMHDGVMGTALAKVDRNGSAGGSSTSGSVVEVPTPV